MRVESQEEDLNQIKRFLLDKEKENLRVKRNELSANFMVSGIEEAENETPEMLKHSVKELTRDMNVEVTIESAVRVGKANGRRPRLIRVVTKTKNERNQVLKNSKSLKDIPCRKNIFINPDRCYLDRIENSRLRKVMRDLKEAYPMRRIVLYKGKVLMDGEVVDFEKPLNHVFADYTY